MDSVEALRSELIAIDEALAIVDDDRREPLRERKRALERAWLGDLADDARTDHGAIEIAPTDHEIDETVWPYVRKVGVAGNADEVSDALAGLVRAPRVMLERLSIKQAYERRPLEQPSVDALIAATPSLIELHVSGHRVIEAFPHPRIDRLVVDGHDALGTLLGRGVMPSVRTLDLALHPDAFIDAEPAIDELLALLTNAALPQLVRLDVSRNEPNSSTVMPNTLGGETPIFGVLERLPIADVRELRVPSIRDREQLVHLQRTIDGMRSLRSIEIARMYFAFPVTLHHPTARVEVCPPIPLPWPPASELRDYDALIVDMGGTRRRAELSRALEITEERFATMTPSERDAWIALWALVRELGFDDARTEPLDHATLQTLLGTFGEGEYSDWDDLRAFVDEADVSSRTGIRVRRIDGYERETAADGEASTGEPSARRKPYEPADSPRIRELEAELLASWDLDKLAVYADALQQLGDPRGELIAIDLQLLRQPNEELTFRRTYELHFRVFGEQVQSHLGFAHVELTYGDHKLGALLHGAVERYLGAVTVETGERISEVLETLLAAPRPWLRSLFLELGNEARLGTAAEIVARTPNLEELGLVADGFVLSSFASIAHPNVRRLRLDGYALFDLIGGPWPRVEELDFAFAARSRWHDDLPRQFDLSRFPALVVLDLSRNEPSPEYEPWNRRSIHQGGELDVYDLVANLPDETLRQLRRLRLPSPRHAGPLQDALDRMPALESLEIVRRYEISPEVRFHHPRARIDVPVARKWPPSDQVASGAVVIVRGVGESNWLSLDAGEVVRSLDHDPAIRADVFAAWQDIWTALVADGRAELPASRVYLAALGLRESPLSYMISDDLERLAALLRPLGIAGANVTLHFELP